MSRSHSPETVSAALDRQGNRCSYCGEPIGPNDYYEAHHGRMTYDEGVAQGLPPAVVHSVNNCQPVHADCPTDADGRACHYAAHGNGLYATAVAPIEQHALYEEVHARHDEEWAKEVEAADRSSPLAAEVVQDNGRDPNAATVAPQQERDTASPLATEAARDTSTSAAPTAAPAPAPDRDGPDGPGGR